MTVVAETRQGVPHQRLLADARRVAAIDRRYLVVQTDQGPVAAAELAERLDALARLPPAQWTAQDARFVSALAMLGAARIRLEQVGMRLDHDQIRDRLRQVYRDYACLGGTLARLAARGHDVHIVVSSLPDHRERRLAELEAGAAKLGVTPHVLDRPGCWQVEAVPVYELVAEFDRFVARLTPDLVFTHWTGDAHHDHVRVATAAVSAARDSRIDLYFADQANQYAPTVGAFPANTYVDVSDYLEQQLAALSCHTSQTSRRNYVAHLTARAQYHGDRIGCRYAEAFHCVRQRLAL